MKRVTINKWEKALVFKGENYIGLLNEGNHWILPFRKVLEYKMSDMFRSPINLNILLKDHDFLNAVEVVEVQKNEIVLRFENGMFVDILRAGKYVFWKGLIDYKFEKINLNALEEISNLDKSVLSSKELVEFIRIYQVESFEKGILFIDGKYAKTLEAGTYYFWKNSTTISVSKVDIRTMQLEISGQEILTKDKAALRINFYLQYKIVDVIKALLQNKEYEKQVYITTQLALREYVGALTLDELLEKKESVSSSVINALENKTKALGIALDSCGIRDIILPGEMKEIMNQVLIAEKKAQANTIMRREETASTRSLLNTAKLMEENTMLFKLKEMEYVEKIAEKINNISLSGGGQIVDQLKQIFVPTK
jgi:regulator of protease activity HflC (stomatin/prohibitin superfamily)